MGHVLSMSTIGGQDDSNSNRDYSDSIANGSGKSMRCSVIVFSE